MMEIKLKPVARVKNNRQNLIDDFWGNIISEIELDAQIPEKAVDGIAGGRSIGVKYLDAINGTPVLEIKPDLKNSDYAQIRQPGWVPDLMKNYWGRGSKQLTRI